MEGLVLVLIPLLLVLLVGLAAVMFLDVTLLGGDRRADVEGREQDGWTWTPPFIRGSELLSWARGTGEQTVEDVLEDGFAPDTPGRVTRKLHEGLSRAMLPMVSERDAARRMPCPEGGQGWVGVTALEAVAIAERVREVLPPKEREAVLGRAIASADRAADVRGSGTPTCALQGPGGVCLAFETRPLRCRALHASMLAHRMGVAPLELHGDRARCAHARLVTEGVEQGVVRALEEQGLDGKVYELNSALALALSTPDVAQRWASGEDVFATCLPAPESALQH